MAHRLTEHGGISPPQLRLIWVLARQIGWGHADLLRLAERMYDVHRIRRLTRTEASGVIEALKATKRRREPMRVVEWWKRWRNETSKPEWPPVRARLKTLFEQERIPYQFVPHSVAYTAPDLASSMHASRREVAKVVVVNVGGQYVMAVIPSNHQLDLIRFAQVVGVPRVQLANEPEMNTLFPDCQTGAMPPLGNLYGLHVYVDASLARVPEIFFPAGSHYEVVKMRYEDFARLAHPVTDRFVLEPLKHASGF